MAKPVPRPAPKKTPAAAASPSFWNNIPLLGGVVALIVFIVYANTLGHGYALDDVAVIHQNRFVKNGFSGIPDILTTFYWAGYWDTNAGLYRPLSLIMFAVEWELFPNQPAVGHFMNILLYAVTCFLLFRISLRLFKNYPPAFSFAITLLFALHPIHTEVVANIKSRDELLCLLFFFLSVHHLLNYLEKGKMISQVYTAVFFFLSLLSKEGGLLFLFVYPLILYFFSATSWKKTGSLMIPLVIVAAAWYGLHAWVIARAPMEKIQYTYMDNSLVAARDYMGRLATAFTIMGRYFRLLVFPHPLSYDYSYSQVPNVTWSNPGAIVSFLLCIGLAVIAIRQAKKKTLLSFSILFFFITISLTSNIIMLIGATMADRFLFVPSLGFCIAIVWLIYEYGTKKQKKKQVLVYSLVPFFLLLGYKTITRNSDWKNDETLFVHDVKSAPNSSRTHYNAATALIGPALKETDENKKAVLLDRVIAELETSLKIDSNYASAWMNYGVALYHRKLYDRSAYATSRSLQLNPGDSSLYSNLGDAYFMNKNYDSAIVYFARSVKAGVIYKDTYNRMGSAYFSLGQFDRAIESYKAGIVQDSAYADLWLNLGNAYGVTKQYMQANEAFEKAYRLNPANPQPLYFIAMTYQNMGDIEKANEYTAKYNAAIGKTSQ